MKTLYFCRHAKSDWSTSLPDHERPLNERGLQSIPIMAKVWQSLGDAPEKWISSSAERALRTAQLMSNDFKHSVTIKVEHKLYHADVKDWMELIAQLPNESDSIALFGHNPSITDIVNYLSGSDIDNIPTCGMVKITFETDDWNAVSNNTGSLEWFEIPKKHM